MGCKISTLLASYLGLPLGASYKSKRIWEPVIEKMSSRLDSWKAPLLSKGGRLTLVKATLAAMPNYFLSFYCVILGCQKDGEVVSELLWNDSTKYHKFHLVDWNSCCKPLEKGGLGIRKIRDHNKALLTKWLWRFGSKHESLEKGGSSQIWGKILLGI